MEKYDIRKYLQPVWEEDIVYYETVMFIDEDECAPLLYPIKEIIGVYDYGLQTEYVKGVDYEIIDGKIKRIKDGKMPYMPIDEYYLTEPAKFAIGIVNNREKAPVDKKYFSFGEKDSYTKYQIAVTYCHNREKAIEPPKGKSARLKNFIGKLNNKCASVVFYGDSITAGCNVSGTPYGGNTPPYMDDFSVMVCKYLSKEYGFEVKHKNTAVGGWDALTGLNNFEEKVNDECADLMVLGFGMNDGRTPLEDYSQRIEKMVQMFKEKNPESEVVLIATTYPNTESDWVRNQPLQADELYKLEEKYPFVAVCDMTKMHFNLLETGKRYRDMTGNNVNHPNDFLARIYAQTLLKTILG